MKHVILLALLSPVAAAADCYCTCINGQNQPICSDALEIPPICGPRICPIEPPSIPPVSAPRIPPLGTEMCSQELVWDYNLDKYVWKEICR